MERAWSIDVVKSNSNIIGIAYDEGTIVIKIGSDEPVVSINNGKIIVAKNMDILSANLKSINSKIEIKNNEKIDINLKELGASEMFPLVLF